MDSNTRGLLSVLLQEADVLDVDFSVWGKRIRLVVFAGLYGENFDAGGRVIHAIDFEHVTRFDYSVTKRASLPEGQHPQWVVLDFAITERRESVEVTLLGFGLTPRLTIECASVTVATLDASILDRVNPRWAEPYQPLARPGLVRLALDD